MLRHWRKALDVMLCNFYPPQYLHCNNFSLARWIFVTEMSTIHYGENISISFNQDLLLRYPQGRCILGRYVAGIAEIKSTISNLITLCNYCRGEQQ